MRVLADEHIPPAVISGLRGEGHDVAVVGEVVRFGASDQTLLEYAVETNRVILSEDTDFRGTNPDFPTAHSGVLVCDTSARPGEIAAAVSRVDTLLDRLDNLVFYVPGNW